MIARVTYVQKTKNPKWDVVHCINDDIGQVAIALCKSGVKIDDLVQVSCHHNSSGGFTYFATIEE